ncbi:uncharacterized protein LOC112512205 [Cynara cardunculus var. scolymus]|uniref:uncharacterized protein LOC112512205 n=1 Tax=Cynara cardunculus var. scolymus TaxID=59895 RepID=UPI000D626B9E|nr:uncharacterized protein LOC112512205 [Cynara cardunculus var. scolymus]
MAWYEQQMFLGTPRMTTVGSSGHRRCKSEIVTSLNTQNQNNGFQRLKTQMQKALNWGGNQEQAFFNPEILANQKRQWYQFHTKSSDITKYEDPSSLFEHFLVAGIHPNANLEPVEDAFARRKNMDTKVDPTELMDPQAVQFQSPPTPNVMMEPQILFKYPPGKKLSMRLEDLASFCFPAGVKAHVLERTPSLSELNQLVYGQEHLNRDDLSFIFSLKVADNATLYGICLQTQDFVQRPPGMLGTASSLARASRGGSRCLVSAPRCYCILTRVPFFELHYEMLNSIIAQERLNRITHFASEVSLDHVPSAAKLNDQAVECTDDTSKELSWMDSAIPVDNELAISPPSAAAAVIIDNVISSPSRLETGSPSSAVFRDKSFNKEIQTETVGRKDLPDLDDSNHDALEKRWEYLGKMHGDYETVRREYVEACVFPPSQTLERLGSSGPLFSSVKGVVSEDEDVVLSCSDKDAINKAIMEWAREHKNDLLQIVCGYHALPVPSYGGKIVFRPLEHLQTIEYYRTAFSFGEDPKEQILDIPDKVKFKLAAIEEAVSLSNWTTATICRVLSLENILILLAGVLLEKQVIITSPNLGVLSATVLSLIPMILPFEWQSLFLPVLPGKMFDFLDAPVPFVVGILHKPADNKIKTSNLVHVDLTHNEVEISSLPPFPKLRELITRLGPLHARLAADKSAIRKHPVYRLNKFQNEAAAQFLTVLRQHLESLCTNLSSHAITSVQSDDDRVSLLMKESYIDSFPARDRPFIRQFVDTQMFTVLSDTRLSRIQNLT